MLGRYHLIEEIDQDALGFLYLSRLEGPSGFQRWAVVRRVDPELERDGVLVDAFYEAARVAALVQHPNVAVVFDVGQRDGPSWVAREYLHGETLADLIDVAIETRMPVPWDLACRIVANAALGAETLHDLYPGDPSGSSPDDGSPAIGFLEGVLTPVRAVVTYDGKTKLVEGCLPLIDGRPSLDVETLAYRAPELTDDKVADVRAEVFALGVCLWELCAGKRLFFGGSEAETRSLVRARAIPFLRASVRCPSMVDEVIRRALAREPEVRHPSCRILARELEACLVAKGLNVTDDDIGRYMLGIFADRFEEREESLLSAANVTEVFDRAEIQARIAAAQVASQRRPRPPGDEIDNTETPEVTTAFAMKGILPATPAVPGITLPWSDSGEATVVMVAPEAPETQPVDLVGKKQTLIGGFDELPTAPRKEPPVKPAVTPLPPESVVFVSAKAPTPDDVLPDSLQDLAAETVRNPPRLEDDDGTTTATVANEPKKGSQPDTRVVPMPLLPGKPPTLSAVLIAHERPKPTWVMPALALGLVAVVGVVGTLVFRHFAYDDEAVVVRAVPSVPSATPAPRPSPTPSATVASAPPPLASASAAPVVAIPGGTPPAPSSAASATAAPRASSAPGSTPPASETQTRRGSSSRGSASPGKMGQLTVFCTPACDEVIDGGRSLGPSPVFKVSVPVGPHRITLVSTDPPVRKVVSVAVGEEEVAVVREAMGGP
jgi:Protein tyrosine and serine/threonine kinase